MTHLCAAVIQTRSGRDIARNVEETSALIRAAARAGARYVQTPEMTHLLEKSRKALFSKIAPEDEDEGVAAYGRLAGELGIHLHIGSLAIRTGADSVANRGFLFAPDGGLVARYDKIHMFDVDLPNGESWRESATYAPGSEAVVVDLPDARLGMGVCYDIRFPALYRAQARAGAQILTAPAAFTRQTGEAHWHILQRARAIETGAFVVSAAQGGRHEDGRETYGHSLVVAPWGEILVEIDHDEPGYALAELDLDQVAAARQRIPALANGRDFDVVQVGANAGVSA
ncbi:carbon-nitrogen hydrolase family protein [Stappia sp. ES.058]|uniref:carbon-nitrogen hydrolase family protein n=1 Tax=Stappia sp. ES.058 TaxID=1881061 RepID=UPI00087CBFD2|nr:carbon-nitrogen hydrolase family protein [Stappia sp. ES.058]SDU37705.1 Predicted amidohydrolase [Stappia sp. ES.058]